LGGFYVEMVEEEAAVEHETGIVECERLALVRSSGDDYLSDARIFKVGTFYLLVEVGRAGPADNPPR